jgi:hypothetical protein
MKEKRLKGFDFPVSFVLNVICRDTYQRQVTQHGCLPSLLGDGDKNWNSVRFGKIFSPGPTRAAKAEQKNRQNKPIEPTKEEPLSFVLFESPFTSVSTVSRGHPSLASLAICLAWHKRELRPLINTLFLPKFCFLWNTRGFYIGSKTISSGTTCGHGQTEKPADWVIEADILGNLHFKPE